MISRPPRGHVAHERLDISGEWVLPSDGRLVEVINPTTEEAIGQAALAGPSDVDRAVRAARAALDDGPWALSTVQERAAVLTRAGELIEARADEFARLLTLEVGSPQNIASVQPLACKLFLDWHAAQAATLPVGG
jgi:aldehyde dehydrogenase (NAD+)